MFKILKEEIKKFWLQKELSVGQNLEMWKSNLPAPSHPYEHFLNLASTNLFWIKDHLIRNQCITYFYEFISYEVDFREFLIS